MESIAGRVASPKGTTEAGLAVLDKDAVLDQLVALTIDAAARRGAELADEARTPVACRARAPVLGARGDPRQDETMADQRTFDDRDGWIWFDGKLVPWRDAQVHVLTHALHYASSVFEGQRAYGGTIFRLREHSERLRKSARMLGFEIPWTRRRDRRRLQGGAQGQWPDRRLHAPGRLARVGADGRAARGHPAPRRHRRLGLGQIFRPSEIAAKGIRLDIAPWRRPAPYTAPVHMQGGRPVHDLHAVAAACRGARL